MREMEKETKRHCRKCLTRDMDQNAYFENLHAYIRDLDEALKVEEPLYEERLSLCRKCDLLADGMCRACGCYVELRAVMKKNSCPYEKWVSEKNYHKVCERKIFQLFLKCFKLLKNRY